MSHRVRVSRCRVTRARHRGGEGSVSIERSVDVVLDGGQVHDTGHEGFAVKEGSWQVQVSRSRVWDVERQGLFAGGWDSDTGDIVPDENTVSNRTFGVAACAGAGGLLYDVVFWNNVIYNYRGPGMIVADYA